MDTTGGRLDSSKGNTVSKYIMKHNGKKIEIEVIDEDGEKAIGCNGKWYRSLEDFCQKAEIDGEYMMNSTMWRLHDGRSKFFYGSN